MEIKNTDGKVLISIEGDTLRGADLQGADLRDADLYVGNRKVKLI